MSINHRLCARVAVTKRLFQCSTAVDAILYAIRYTQSCELFAAVWICLCLVDKARTCIGTGSLCGSCMTHAIRLSLQPWRGVQGKTTR